ncbi:MAG TPA: hypothetical protein VM008_18035 [Phycisphaerae bacterium]|nr:hypothetical protein [Phycisphaerae bacterium]
MNPHSFLAMLAGVLVLTGAAFAQVPPGAPDMTPEQQDLQQQMQDMRQKVFDNMQKQGIDPRTFMQDMMQRMADGSLNFMQLQQELVDKGLLDQASVDKLQTQMQKVTDATIRQQLKVTDEEWVVIQPKIQKVLQSQAALGQPGGGGARFGGLMGGFLTNQSGRSDVTVALSDLRAALRTKDTPDDVIKAKMQAVRDARVTAAANLDAAEKDLRDVLTMRQEGVLVRIGILR